MVIRVDVMAAALEAVYGEPADRRARAPARGRPHPARAARSPTPSPASSPGSPSSPCCAAATRASTSACTSVLANDAICLGPFVLAGGEVAAMAVVDAVARRLAGALGNAESLAAESFSEALGGGIEHPHYTRPAGSAGTGCPPVLLLGRPRRDRALARRAHAAPRTRPSAPGRRLRPPPIPCYAPGRFAGTPTRARRARSTRHERHREP